jgi:hypothetical protein
MPDRPAALIKRFFPKGVKEELGSVIRGNVWGAGALEYGSTGVLECWSAGVLELVVPGSDEASHLPRAEFFSEIFLHCPELRCSFVG